MSNIHSLWIQDVKGQEEKDKLIEFLQNHSNDRILTKLKEIIKRKQLSYDALERDTKAYDKASWAYYQAHCNGARQTLKLMEDLLSFVH